MPIPEGFHTITPYLVVQNAAKAMDLYARAFGAVPGHRDIAEDGRIRHAQFRIGDSHVMITDGSPEFSYMPPIQHFGGSPMHLFLYVEDADATFASAVAAGMKPLMEMSNQPYGRTGGVQDEFGFIWWITTAP